MCENCGCSTNLHEDGHMHHDHGHDHHHHSHNHPSQHIELKTDILTKNNLLAERNRGYFQAKNIKAINLVSSPGSGKTTILEKLIVLLKDKIKISVIEGDQQTSNDAKRIEATGVRAVQINTGNGCHLDAHMIQHALPALKPEDGSLLFIENVGNLVCPALFDLGEELRIVIASTTEGEDKPLKYPNMFHSSDICVLNKTDLLPYLDFDQEAFRINLKMIKPEIKMIEVSAKTGEGIDELGSMFIKTI